MSTVTKVTILPVTNPNPNAPQLTSTAFTPAMLGASLVGWLRADAGTTVDSTGVNVTAIADQSNTGVPALVQATTADTPNLIPAAQNGLPTLALTKFVNSSVQPFLQAGSVAQNWAFQPNQPFTVAVAFKKSPVLGPDGSFINALIGQLNWASVSSANGWFLGIERPSPGSGIVFSLNGGSSFATTNCINVAGSTSLLGGGNYTAIASYDGSGKAAGVSLRVNGQGQTNTVIDDALPATINYAAATPALWMPNAGGGQNADTFFEAIVVNRQLSIIETTSLNSYLRSKWGF